MRVALDAMGGDYAPSEVVKGALQAKKEWDNLEIILVGDREKIGEVPFEVVHTQVVVEPHELPGKALKEKPDSSIGIGVRMIREGRADAFVSAGNTGAVMAFSLINLGRIKGVKRPALATFFPTRKGHSLVLDVGANSDVKPIYLYQFGVMGSIYLSRVYGIEKPAVGLLSMGEEETKGNKLIEEAHELMKQSPHINFYGNIEGHDILEGKVDVVVCDGFTGNAVLKFGESLVEFMQDILKEEAKKSLRTMIGGILFKPAFKELLERVNYEEYGGAILLGVRGIVVVSHGKSKAKAIKNAIGSAYRFYRERVNEIIREELE